MNYNLLSTMNHKYGIFKISFLIITNTICNISSQLVHFKYFHVNTIYNTLQYKTFVVLITVHTQFRQFTITVKENYFGIQDIFDAYCNQSW